MVALLLALNACSIPCDCTKLQDVERENCWLAKAEEAQADPVAFSKVLSEITDPRSRDLLLIRLMVQDPSRAPELCSQVETLAGQERCHQIIVRPHLSVKR